MHRSLLLDLASVTKAAATSTIAMILTHAGELEVEARVQRYLPGFGGGAKDEVTVEQLLTHTGGLQAWWPLYYQATDRSRALVAAATLPLTARPGTTWRYSDLGLILAGQVIEEVTGLGLDRAFRTMVAEPLGLTARYGPVPPETAAASSVGDAYEFAMVDSGEPYPVPFGVEGFDSWRTGELRGVANDGNAAHALAGVAGHAGLFATVDDLLRLGKGLRDGRLVPSAVLERYAEPAALNPEQAIGFRRTVLVAGTTRTRVLHHPGFTGTYFAVGLDEELVVAGGAMRLYGALGAIPDDGSAPDREGLVTTAEIQDLLLAAACAALSHDHTTTATHGEER
jgi:CubicO group peptidase (beta-lactamase class C family)